MQVLDSNFVACWKQQYWAPLSWGSMEFSTFLVFAAWTASMTYLTFGKGELQNANHFLSLYSYFSLCYLISHRSLFLFRWSTTVDALSNEKTKNLNSINMTSKGRNLTLEYLFCKKLNGILKRVVIMMGHIANLQQYWAPLSWGSMEFSTFLVFAVWTALMTYLTFGKGELQNANHFLSLYSYFSLCYPISHRSLILFRWFTTVDTLRNLSLVNLFCKHWVVF